MAIFIIIFGIFGAVFGSFACCQAWRLKYQEDRKDKLGERSICLNCGKQLKWYENIPIISWVVQGGKCRKCKKPIGKAEILSELFGAGMFIGIGIYYLAKYASLVIESAPGEFGDDVLKCIGCSGGLGVLENILFFSEVIVCIVLFIMLLIIAIYDAKWQKIPMKIVIPAIIVSILFAGIRIFGAGKEWLDSLFNVILCVFLLGGMYFCLYKLSKEKLVGSGDYLIAIIVGLVLGDWWLGLLALFLANLAALIVMVPQKKRKIAFGPFLVFALVIVFCLSEALLRYKLVV